nr:MAG TPA_asm: hypothetical protein [Caudoviricetes sp.]
MPAFFYFWQKWQQKRLPDQQIEKKSKEVLTEKKET